MRASLGILAFAAALAAPLPTRAVGADYDRTPVLMVHGWFVIAGAGDATWAHIRGKLMDDGWPGEHLSAPSFADVRGCDPEHATTLGGWVDDLLADTGFDRVDIVCHSEGCLNSLYYIKHLCGAHKVRRVVMLAGAVHGTAVACIDPFSCGSKEMCVLGGKWQDNEVLATLLAGDETPGDVLYTCVWSEYDEIIVPASGGQLAGANNIEVQTPFVEHGGIFLCDECYGYVKDALLNGTGKNEDGPGWETFPACAPVPPEVEAEPVPEEVPEPVAEAAADAPVEAFADVADPTPDAATDAWEARDDGDATGSETASPHDAAASGAPEPGPAKTPPTVGGCVAGGAAVDVSVIGLLAWTIGIAGALASARRPSGRRRVRAGTDRQDL
jgi:triacylglycerol lipase